MNLTAITGGFDLMHSFSIKTKKNPKELLMASNSIIFHSFVTRLPM